MIKAVIFDVDGVLLDNTKDFLKAYKETGRRLKLKVPSETEFKKLFGMPWYKILQEIYGYLDDDMKKTYREIISKVKMKRRKGLMYLLKNLKLRKAIVTSKSKEDFNDHMGDLKGFFEVIITRDDVENHKPNPDPILLACRRLGIKPEEAVYVGDSVVDYQAARNAGMSFTGVISGAASEKDFRELGVKYITTLKDLVGELQ